MGLKKASASPPHLALTYPMENKMPLIHHTIKQQGCDYIVNKNKSLNERIQKHPKTRTQVQANASGVGTRKGIELRWSWGFGLDELGV